ncbi:hypothetical protein FKM82_017620 [Ascaphus truei]
MDIYCSPRRRDNGVQPDSVPSSTTWGLSQPYPHHELTWPTCTFAPPGVLVTHLSFCCYQDGRDASSRHQGTSSLSHSSRKNQDGRDSPSPSTRGTNYTPHKSYETQSRGWLL